MSADHEADKLAEALQSKLNLSTPGGNDDEVASRNLKKMAKWIEESERILVLTGAGVVRTYFSMHKNLTAVPECQCWNPRFPHPQNWPLRQFAKVQSPLR